MIKSHGLYYIDDSRENFYYTKIKEKLYYKNGSSTFLKMKRPVEIITDECLSHNFSPRFIDGEYIVLSGQDSWKQDKKWRGIDFETFKITYEDHFKKPYIRGEEFYKIIKQKFDATNTSEFCKGLYLLKSKDGIDWNKIQDEPVVTVNNKGFVSSLDWKSSEFDGRPCLVKRFDKYWLYVRNNIGKDRRTIQVSNSSNLIEWSEFKEVNFGYDILFDNYYLCEVFIYRKNFFMFAPYYNDFKCCIKLLTSSDGYNFKNCADLFVSYPAVVEGWKRKNRDQIVFGVEENEDDFYFYVHHNYCGLDKNHDVIINKYSISKKELKGYI